MKKLFFGCVILYLVGLVLIFVFSNQSSVKSYEITGKVASFIIGKPHTQQEWDRYGSYIPVIRKTAHIVLYCGHACLLVMIIILYWEIKRNNNISHTAMIISAVVSIVIAGFDELHQVFVSGRGATIIDILFDSVGSVLGIVIGRALYKLLLRQIIKRKTHTTEGTSEKSM